MPVTRWTIFDSVANVTETFVINPNRGGSPQYRKTFRETSTLAPGGNALLFEGQRPLKTGSFSGTILSAAQYNQLKRWWEKPNPLVVTDDLGREMTIVISEFLPDRVYSGSNFYRHDFTVNYLILSGTDL